MAYKIVTEKERLGTNAALAMRNYSRSELTVRDFIKYPEYYPIYSKGALITAIKGSAGICCFKTFASANRFIGNSNELRFCNLLIVKVKGFKKVINPILKAGCGTSPEKIISNIKLNCVRELPKGFISFEKVKVLE